MKIECNENKIPFGKVKDATLFRFEDNFFLKTEPIEGTYQLLNAVNLADGTVTLFDDETFVVAFYDSKIIV